jgi:hypothetical protein
MTMLPAARTGSRRFENPDAGTLMLMEYIRFGLAILLVGWHK